MWGKTIAVAVGVCATGWHLLPTTTTTTPYQPSSLQNKVILITGGNTGLGLESSKRLALAGATVILTARTIIKGEEAVKTVKEYVVEQGGSNDKVVFIPLELSDLNQVRKFVPLLKAALRKAGSRRTVDVLLNNAGVMAIPDRRITGDGYELTFQTNHLAHFLLTATVFPLLSERNARVITVSSAAWSMAKDENNKIGIDFDNLQGEKYYRPWVAYGQSKLANILFTKELQSRIDASNQNIKAVTLHPGAVATDLGRHMVGEEKFRKMREVGHYPTWGETFLFNTIEKFLKTTEEGASTQIYLASGGGVEDDEDEGNIGGEYFVNCVPKMLSGAAVDMDAAKKLWEVSERLVGKRFQLS